MRHDTLLYFYIDEDMHFAWETSRLRNSRSSTSIFEKILGFYHFLIQFDILLLNLDAKYGGYVSSLGQAAMCHIFCGMGEDVA
jgi:hypothetical protein